uniref:Uncharacterized protein n=1 Tax=Oryza sativa subsp. japonica TaxID=39947 RepID=Q6K3L2_ORYSJ|nr:hypothetical protein [Oryza sativa Japonica Group]
MHDHDKAGQLEFGLQLAPRATGGGGALPSTGSGRRGGGGRWRQRPPLRRIWQEGRRRVADLAEGRRWAVAEERLTSDEADGDIDEIVVEGFNEISQRVGSAYSGFVNSGGYLDQSSSDAAALKKLYTEGAIPPKQIMAREA